MTQGDKLTNYSLIVYLLYPAKKEYSREILQIPEESATCNQTSEQFRLLKFIIMNNESFGNIIQKHMYHGQEIPQFLEI